MTQTGAAATKVMGREVRDSCAPGRSLHNVPNRLRSDVFAPDLPSSADGPKDKAGRYPRSVRPDIHRAFHPVWHRNRSHMLSLANQIGYHPVLLPDLEIGDVQADQFRAPEAASDQNRHNSPIALPSQIIRI